MMQQVATTAFAAAWEPRDYAAVASAVVAIVAVISGYFINRNTLAAAKQNSDATIWQKSNELEIKEIQAKLDSFYGPFRYMSQVNMLLNRDLRSRQNDLKFLLIEKLFDQNWRKKLPDGERALLEEIVAKAKELREFIASHLGMIDQKVLPYLARVSAHYRMIELAYENKLGNDSQLFVSLYVFPRQIDEVMRLEVERLERRRAILMARPSAPPPPIELLELPSELTLKDWPNPRREQRPELNMPVGLPTS
ncbi:hypothetical protein [Methylorubrum extorquens]